MKKDRPVELLGKTVKIITGCGPAYITVNLDEDGKPFEVFLRLGKCGGCASAQSEAIGRLVSLIFRCGGTPDRVVHQLRGITCHLPHGIGKNKVRSCADGVAAVLSNYLTGEIETDPINNDDDAGEDYESPTLRAHEVVVAVDKQGGCPECGSPIRHEEGCRKCASCDWSECL